MLQRHRRRRAVHTARATQTQAGAGEWFEWAERYADRIDPLHRPIGWPEVAIPGDYAIERFICDRPDLPTR